MLHITLYFTITYTHTYIYTDIKLCILLHRHIYIPISFTGCSRGMPLSLLSPLLSLPPCLGVL